MCRSTSRVYNIAVYALNTKIYVVWIDAQNK